VPIGFHIPNPLDLIFFAYDDAAERLGLPRGYTHVIWELDGQLDIQRVVEAVRALHTIYPVTAARLEFERFTGRPRWRLGGRASAAEHAVVLDSVDDDGAAARRKWFEALPYRPHDLAAGPPLVWHIRRGPSGRDVCALRYPHALMDARAGLWIHEELDRVYVERPALESLRTAGDETRADFGPLLDGLSAWKRVLVAREALRRGQALPAEPRRLVQAAMPSDLGRLRGAWRHLTPDETLAVRANADRHCGVGRFADFVRACGLRALHELLPAAPAGATYALLNVFERRNRRQPLRQICNLSTSVPVVVAAEIADDIKRVADAIREQTGERLAAGVAVEHACALWLMTRAPTAWLGGAAARKLRPDEGARRPSRRFGLAPPPSLPLGVIGQTSRPMRSFCGVPVLNYHGFSPPVPDNGFAITVNMTDSRLNLSLVYHEHRVVPELATTLLDRCAALLLDRATIAGS
jgi:hypothetical protein